MCGISGKILHLGGKKVGHHITATDIQWQKPRPRQMKQHRPHCSRAESHPPPPASLQPKIITSQTCNSDFYIHIVFPLLKINYTLEILGDLIKS